ncbi:hypothetical protein NEOLEDRAFT_1022270, partial [Neolentinus lepideus HHB14362 ss-1]
VILAIDTYIAVGYYLCQQAMAGTKNCNYSQFSSITLNVRDLCVVRLYLLGVCNLVVKVNVCYIKGMLQNPDIALSASINCRIVSILTFHFKLVHVPGVKHGPDGLSRYLLQPDDPPQDEDPEFDNWIDHLHSF